MKLWILPIPLLLVACQPSQPDMTPVGSGLAVVGLSILLAAFVIALIK